MTLPEQYAHDYRDMAMSEEELRKMLEEFADEIRKERVTHCDDINCPECNRVAYQAGVKYERERVRELEEEELRSLVGALYDEFCETQLATEQQWNEAIAPKLKRLANLIRGLDPESVTARQYKFPRHLYDNK